MNDLITKIYEEYKKYCEKNGISPVKSLAILKEEGIPSRKGSNI